MALVLSPIVAMFHLGVSHFHLMYHYISSEFTLCIHILYTQLWDVSNAKLVRRMKTHESRVDSLAWSPKTSLLSSGDQQGFIHHYDPRMAQFHIASVRAHQMDVCGLQWSPNGRFLASGGNDNVVKIWDTYSKDTWNSPAHTIKHHTAAVKVLCHNFIMWAFTAYIVYVHWPCFELWWASPWQCISKSS